MTATAVQEAGIDRAHRRVIFASSLGTVFEWFDFYLYGTLAVFFGSLFFPPGNDTARTSIDETDPTAVQHSVSIKTEDPTSGAPTPRRAAPSMRTSGSPTFPGA